MSVGYSECADTFTEIWRVFPRESGQECFTCSFACLRKGLAVCMPGWLELLLQPFVAEITHRHLHSWYMIQSLVELISSLCERMCTQ